MNRFVFGTSAWAPRLLSVMRIMVGLLYLEHGTQKIFEWPFNKFVTDIQLLSLNGAAGLMELIGSPLIIVGLFTRPVAFLLSGEMAIGYFLRFAPKGFFPATNGGEVLVLYCFVYLYLAFAGGGAWSLDVLMARDRQAPAPR